MNGEHTPDYTSLRCIRFQFLFEFNHVFVYNSTICKLKKLSFYIFSFITHKCRQKRMKRRKNIFDRPI